MKILCFSGKVHAAGLDVLGHTATPSATRSPPARTISKDSLSMTSSVEAAVVRTVAARFSAVSSDGSLAK